MKKEKITVNTINLEKLADDASEIIMNPEENINKISEIINLYKKSQNDIILLTLTKIFKNIVPLYKIRIHSDVVKHKNQKISVSNFDKNLLEEYNKFMKILCSTDSNDSYKAAAELLKNLDHFNFADRLVAKVLIGSNKKSVSEFCLEVLLDKIRNDKIGDNVFIIIDKCLDCKFSHILVDALNNSIYLENCIQIRKDKVDYYEKENIEKRKKEGKEVFGKGFFKKTFSNEKKVLKEEKKRLKLQKEVRREERIEIGEINDKNYIKTVNALQRLYFTIFKTQNINCFKSSYQGIRKYITLIRKEFREGLYTLLNDSIKYESDIIKNNKEYNDFYNDLNNTKINASISSCLEGMFSVLEIYKTSGLDFKRIIDIFYYFVYPLNFNLEISDFEMIYKVGRILFIENIQPKNRIIALMQRLMILRVFRHSLVIPQLIKDLEVKYDIEIKDNEIKNKKVLENSEDIDKVGCKPFYEYYLYKKML